MTNDGGYVRVFRKMADSAVMSDDWLCRLWMSCLLKANWKTGWFKGEEIQVGSFAFSYRLWSEKLEVSIGKLVRGVKRLEKLEQITVKAERGFTVITLCNYKAYNSTEEEMRNTDGHTDGHANGTQTDTQTGDDRRRKAFKEEEEVNRALPKTTKASETASTPVDVFDIWNVTVGKSDSLRAARKLTKDRKAKIALRLKDPEWFDQFKEALALLPIPGDGWQPDIDWLAANDSNVFKVLEGKFDFRVQKDSEQRGNGSAKPHDPTPTDEDLANWTP